MAEISCERVRVPLSAPQVLPDTGAVVWNAPSEGVEPGVVLAPGAGTDITNPMLRAVGKGLAAHGHPVALFNFGYTEAGRRRPDPAARLERAYRDVLTAIRERWGDRPVVIGGRSMGGRIASHLAADGEPCAGLLLLGYPLYPRRRAGEEAPVARLRTGHWPRLRVPTLFVQGDRDAMCDLAVLERERAAHLEPALNELHVVEGADHSFDVRKRDGRTAGEIHEEVVGVAAAWLAKRCAPARSEG